MRRRAFAIAAAAALVLAAGVLVLAPRTIRPVGWASTSRGVITRLQKGFGDHLIARVTGPTAARPALQVELTRPPVGAKGPFEAQVLASALADWLRSEDRRSFSHVSWGYDGSANLEEESVPVAPTSTVSREVCASAAKAAVSGRPRSVFAHASSRWLPYLHGTCVIHVRALPANGVNARRWGAVVEHRVLTTLAPRVPSNVEAWPPSYVEVDDDRGKPLLWVARLGGWSETGRAAPRPRSR
jgi:hypothetical protein